MTCIVGLIDNKGKIWMGGDSAATSNALDKWTLPIPKVFKKGEYLIGCSGDYRVVQEIYNLNYISLDTQSPDSFQHVSAELVPYLQTIIGGSDFHLLIGYRHQLFEVFSEGSVIQNRKSYAAVGSGTPYALGALANSSGNPRKRIEKALAAAESHNAGVGGPFTIIHS